MNAPDIVRGEKFGAIVKPHWITLVMPIAIAAVLFAVSLLLFLLAGLSAHHYMWLSHLTFLAAIVLFLITHHWFFITILSYKLETIIITNRRLFRFKYRLIVHEDILEVSFEKMKTVDAEKKGLLQNFLHYGTLSFETKLATIPYVAHPNRVAQLIQKAMHEIES